MRIISVKEEKYLLGLRKENTPRIYNNTRTKNNEEKESNNTGYQETMKEVSFLLSYRSNTDSKINFSIVLQKKKGNKMLQKFL